MIDIRNEKECCGCGACLDACPKQAISFKEGMLGAIFPSVDTSKCIDCGLCNSVCPMQHAISGEISKQEAYAAYNKEKQIRWQSSSGGMFSTFAYELIEQGYRVYGAAFDEKLKLRTVSTDSAEGILPLCKSKYLQSDMRGVYRDIKERLGRDEKILFVGTPCQTVALKGYLKKDYDNLILVDFFCHGVPSQAFFDQCMALEGGKKEIKGYSFRTKVEKGVTPHYYTAQYPDTKKVTKLYFYSKFYAAFQSYVNLRESCYDCRFSGRERASDITIGDFHDIERYVKEIDRFDGISMVIVHTEKGKELWNQCEGKVVSYGFEVEQLIADGQCFHGGTGRVAFRDAFVQDYSQMSFNELMKKYFPLHKYWKQMIYYHCPKVIRNTLKKLGGL